MLRSRGNGRTFLTAAALDWAGTHPQYPDAPEMLARAIQGWRWSACSFAGEDASLPRRAFGLLHRQYPRSEWTRRTPYWYR